MNRPSQTHVPLSLSLQNNAVISGLAFVLTLICVLWAGRYGVDAHHDGVILKPALDVAAGKRVFTDTFSQYGPLTTWLHALAIQIWGPSLYSLRILAAIAYAVTAILLIESWSVFLPRRYALASWLLWLVLASYWERTTVLMSWASTLALPFQAGALLCMLVSIQGARASDHPERGLPYSILSGVLVIACLACRQTVGLALGGTWIVCLVWLLLITPKRKPVLWTAGGFAGGLALGAGLLVGVLSYQGSIDPWISQNYSWPAEWARLAKGTNSERVIFYLMRYRNESLVLLGVLLLLRPAITYVPKLVPERWRARSVHWIALAFALGIFWRFPLPAYACGTFTLVGTFLAFTGIKIVLSSLCDPYQARNTRGQAMLLACAFGVASWTQFYPTNDARHVYWAIGPAIGIFMAAIWSWAKGELRAVAWCLGVWITSATLAQAPEAIAKAKRFDNPIESPRFAGIRETSEEAGILKTLHEVLSEAPERPILVEGPDSIYAAMAIDLDQPSYMPQIWRVGSLPATHFTPEGIIWIQAKKPWIIAQFPENQGEQLHPSLPDYRPAASIRDIDRPDQVIVVWRPDR